MVAALSGWHEHHEAAAAALDRVFALPAHVALESYSVLTRLPGGLAVPAETASKVLAQRFPEQAMTLRGDRGAVVAKLAAAGVVGGASYDGLVALEAAAHDAPLLTLDRRAQDTYRRLGVGFSVVA